MLCRIDREPEFSLYTEFLFPTSDVDIINAALIAQMSSVIIHQTGVSKIK